jgi:hydroxymethylbilane synthase
MTETLRILTRVSELAVTQAKLVQAALARAQPQLRVELHPIKALGDKYRDRWQEFSATHTGADLSKRKWTFELEEAIANGEYELAIHSGKDLPRELRADTALLPVLERADPRDVFIGRRTYFDALPQGAQVGTDSRRRKAQLLRLRPDLQIVPHDGNVPTRIAKLQASAGPDGIVLAAAGLQRLGIEPFWLDIFDVGDFVPAAHQGILVAQYQSANERVATALRALLHPPTHAAWLAERAVLATLQADCQTALGALALVEGNELRLTIRGLSPDGCECLEETATAPLAAGEQLGERVARRLIARGLLEMLRAGRQTSPEE